MRPPISIMYGGGLCIVLIHKGNHFPRTREFTKNGVPFLTKQIHHLVKNIFLSFLSILDIFFALKSQ